MNLKENYERLFGKMVTENKLGQRMNQSEQKNVITEQDNQKFFNLQKRFQQQYPTKQLRLREGYVLIDNLIVEQFETFIKKDNNTIIHTLKSFIK